MNRFCLECGNAVKPDTKFCGNCGTGAAAQAPVISIAVPQPSSANTQVLPSPPSLHWGILLALSLVTFGVFMWIWAFVQAVFVKRLTGTWKPLICFSVLCTWDIAIIVALINPGFPRLPNGGGWVAFAFAGLILRQYVVKHYNTIEPINLKINYWKTFWGGIFYLQYHLTRIARLKKEQPQLFAPYAIPQLSYKEEHPTLIPRQVAANLVVAVAAVLVAVALLVGLFVYIDGSRNGTAEPVRQSAPQASTVAPKPVSIQENPALSQQPSAMIRFDSAQSLIEGEEQVRGKFVSMKATVSSVDDNKIEFDAPAAPATSKNLATGDDSWSVVCQPPPDQRERVLALKQGQDIALVGIVPTDGVTQLLEPSSGHAGIYELRLTECRLNQEAVETSIAPLEGSLAGSDLNDIRAKTQSLATASRDPEQFVGAQHASAEALVKARQAGNQELERTRGLLSQALGYPKLSQVVAAQKPLELALTGEDIGQINVKTQALEAANRELDQFIRSASVGNPSQRSGAEAAKRMPETFLDFLMIALAVDWLYCFYRGFQNKIVLYFDKKDVFISLLGAVLLIASYWAFDSRDEYLGPLLVAGGAVASYYTIRSSITHNGTATVGIAVGIFKLTFSVLWLGLVFGQLGRGGDKNKSARERDIQRFYGFIVFVLLLLLMEKLINGPDVYARRQGTDFQPA